MQRSRRSFIHKGLFGGAATVFSIRSATGERLAADLTALKSPETDENYWELVRDHFPLSRDKTYFNNGTMGPTPSYTLQKMQAHTSHYSVNAADVDYKNGSGPALLTGYFPYIELREKVGKIINADYQNIALTQNATFGMNYVANGLSFKKGDELLNTNQEHGGGFAAWQQAAKRWGCTYKQAEIPIPCNDPQQIYDAIFAQVTKKTRVIAIPHIVSVYGTVLPVKSICEEARKRGIFTILDGAQCVGQVKVDVAAIGCDAYYSSLHKWMLAPAGNGILYIHPDRIQDIWATISSYNWDNQEDHGFRIMQNGTGNPTQLLGLDASLDFYNSIGPDRWLGRIKELGNYLREGLQQLDNVTIVSSTTTSMCAGITTYKVKGITGPGLQKAMWEQERLQPRSVGQELLRHSTHIYNSKKEIDRALKVIAGI
ncbi:MAG: aminotransferase class V-fold PLP-dependent enzyme [Cyclobacteriaceae bacterium]|jgi:isopenicillin-N epimerase